MKIDKDLLQTMKDVPNSPYSVISPYFLFHSNKIEGSTFSESELEKLFDRKLIVGTHSVDDVMETMNSIKVLDHVVDTLGEPISNDLLFGINEMLFKGTDKEFMGYTGHYKELSNYISGSSVQVAYPREVKEAMNELMNWWNDSDKDLAAIGHFHVRFEHIHPFQDGNGRVGRFLMLKQCVENNVDIITIEEKTDKPYRAWLEVAQTQGDERFFIDVLKEAQENFDNKMHECGITEETLSEYRKQIPKHTIALEMRRAMVVERNRLDALSTKQFEAQEASARINGSRNKLDAPGLDPR